MLGALMLIGKILFEPLPNVHPLAALVIIYTVVYRAKALIPIYIYVILQGLISGFNVWWLPYIYIWTVLWGITMLLPKSLSTRASMLVYPLTASLHGLMFGALYAPAQAIIFGLDFDGMIKWIIAGFPFDIMHGAGNFVAGLMVLPISKALKKLESL
jgi:energy-coupling factor transport system substrate-specific component